jgi:hypothetical protein
MLRILVPLAVACAVFLFAAVGFSQVQDVERSTPPPARSGVLGEARTTATARVLPPLRLPNIGRELAKLNKADRAVAVRQAQASQNVIRFWSNHRWILAPRHSKCWMVPWQRSCTVARASLRLHTALSARATYIRDHEIPLIGDWRTAVRWVQRIYPGTESWMLAISDREGGWGRWVWYGGRGWSGYHIGDDFLGADTVGGWMQFRYSTFAPYWRGAQKDLRARGYIIPDIPMPPEGGPSQYAAWLSPLGQALTAGYMRANGLDACHWCL